MADTQNGPNAAARGGPGVTIESITKDILDGRSLDFSHHVFGTEPKNLYCPPVVKAYAEEEPADRDGDGHLTLERFEALSLAARGRLLKLSPINGQSAWAQSFGAMQPIGASVLRAAILAAAKIVRENENEERVGLQIIGAYIDDDLDLSHLDLPFSVRLISCAIDGAVRLSRTRMATLDLSGSIVRGVFGSFLRTSGSVRLRRMMSTSVVDFGGAKVDDVFDASDCVVFPLDDPPAPEVFVGDRGIFNLSLARLSNEARLMRSRIYGGLTLKGCRVERSFFLDDAVLRAPFAFLERMGCDVVKLAGGENLLKRVPLAVRTSWRPEEKLAKELHERLPTNERDLRIRFETLTDFNMPAEIGQRIDDDDNNLETPRRAGRLLRRLLMESPRARSACLRADGMTVAGTVFARSIKSSGRLRFNYMRISHSMQLDGARMRSAEDIARGLSAITELLDGFTKDEDRELSWPNYNRFAKKQLKYRLDDLKDVEERRLAKAERASSVKRERAENEAYALDMREVTIGGNVSMKPDQRGGEVHVFDDELGARIDKWMSVECQCETFNKCVCRPRFGRLTCKCWARDAKCQCPRIVARWRKRLENDHPQTHCVYVNGQLALDGAKITGGLDLTGILANLHNADDKFERPADYPPAKSFLLMRHCEVGGEFKLVDSIGIHGIAANHAKIGSRVRFAVPKPADDEIKSPALLLSGVITFADAQIGGDAVFLFDKDIGPSLRMARARVGGRLHILPADSATIASDRKTFQRRRLTTLRIGRIPRDIPEVDLRFVRAAEVGHPDSAWPRPDFLKIEGLVYEQSWIYGPLTAPVRGHERDLVKQSATMAHSSSARTDRSTTDESEAPTADIIVADDLEEKRAGPEESPEEPAKFEDFRLWLAIGLSITFVLAVGLWNASAIDAQVGLVNALVLGSVLLACVIQAFIERISRPRKSDGNPRAIYWLGLQRASTSVYRQQGMTVPLQPYVQAGKVLRSAGLILSANLLEADRLVRRNEQLSWRNNWPSKLLLNLANLATTYGFDPLKTIVIAVVIGSSAAMVFHTADRGGYIRPVDAELWQVAQREQRLELSFACDAEPVGCAARPNPHYPSFNSLLFALDVMTPGLDVGQERYWRASQVSPARPNQQSRLYDFAGPVLKIIGWLLTTAIAISLLTRVEAMIARHEE